MNKVVKPDFKKPETIKVKADIDSVSCDGGGGALGHPVVYYTFEGQDSVECMYCDRVFIKTASKK
ncbi:MAG: zinc-finger domain-containing protein [Alphaproteobacteria bacterium]|nr:zinc-finger domain-containing protein [Alphaproteobacteria bacterium]|tara:strand:- start:661 stop:855 length:195 start_codon:yes stop_codon:yes gene_type:complete